MEYHQIDFLKENSVIPNEGVDLCISSVPLNVLDNHLLELFSIFNRIMKLDGWVLIDAPVSTFHLPHKIKRVSEDAGMQLHHVALNKDMYPGYDQWLFVISNKQSIGSIVKAVSYVLDPKREMSHPCEFDPHIIMDLISRYSKPFDRVLDPFCGTGAVPVIAELLGRHGIGCDLRPKENVREYDSFNWE